MSRAVRLSIDILLYSVAIVGGRSSRPNCSSEIRNQSSYWCWRELVVGNDYVPGIEATRKRRQHLWVFCFFYGLYGKRSCSGVGSAWRIVSVMCRRSIGQYNLMNWTTLCSVVSWIICAASIYWKIRIHSYATLIDIIELVSLTKLCYDNWNKRVRRRYATSNDSMNWSVRRNFATSIGIMIWRIRRSYATSNISMNWRIGEAVLRRSKDTNTRGW